jgi:hypothetical protein
MTVMGTMSKKDGHGASQATCLLRLGRATLRNQWFTSLGFGLHMAFSITHASGRRSSPALLQCLAGVKAPRKGQFGFTRILVSKTDALEESAQVWLFHPTVQVPLTGGPCGRAHSKCKQVWVP